MKASKRIALQRRVLTCHDIGLLLFSLSVLIFSLKSFSSTDLQYAPVTTDRLVHAAQEQPDWLSHGRSYDESRFSPLTQINDQTVQQLGLAWSFEMLDAHGLEATPIVADGVMYSSAAWSHVYAHNAKTGELLWHYDPEVPKGVVVRGCCGPVNRGVAIWEDKVFVGSFDGYLIALDRKTGNVVWRVLTVDPEKDYTITGAPRVVKGNVLIGNGGAEYGVRGYVSAYDAVTGKLNWRFYTVPGNPKDGFENPILEKAAKTWNGEWWALGGGGTVWDSMSYDPELNLLYIGVGNGSPWNQKIRSPGGGDNLFLSSIVALNPDTGAYVWHYQTTPGESWDYTATQQMILADIEWHGAIRKVLMQAPKNGFFFIIDRITGEFLSAEPFTKVKWAEGYAKNGRPIENPGARYQDEKIMMTPSAIGGHNWHSMSYNPQTGLVYIPVVKSMNPYQQPANYLPKPHHANIGVDIPGDSLISPQFMQILKNKITRGELVAWDPIRQQAAWSFKHARSWNGGTLATAGNLVFQGTADHKLMAFNAENGKVLWTWNTQLGIIAAPISYSVEGEQYIAVMAKWGGGFALALGIEPLPGLKNGRLLVFKLNGTASLPQVNDADLQRAAQPSPPPPLTITNENDLREGKQLFDVNCSGCHGNDVVSGGNVPDLRHMDAGRHQAFKAIVLDGILQHNGMVSFRDVLDEPQAEKVYGYILQQAHAEHAEKQDQGSWTSTKLWLYDQLATMLAWAAENL